MLQWIIKTAHHLYGGRHNIWRNMGMWDWNPFHSVIFATVYVIVMINALVLVLVCPLVYWKGLSVYFLQTGLPVCALGGD